jgi:hypothetical protein
MTGVKGRKFLMFLCGGMVYWVVWKDGGDDVDIKSCRESQEVWLFVAFSVVALDLRRGESHSFTPRT